MLANQIAWVALVSNEPAAAARVFEDHFGLARREFASPSGPVPLYAIGASALAIFPPGHPMVADASRPGVHHIALAVDSLDRAVEQAHAAGISADHEAATGLAGRRLRRLARDTAAGVRIVLTERLDLTASANDRMIRIDHLGVASTDVAEDEAVFGRGLGFAVESRQTDMEVSMAVESFTSDKYGVVYHTRPPQPVGGLRVTFITVGDCELEFLANFDPRQQGEVDHGRSGTTRQDQGAIARFVASRGRGLHHVALKTHDIDGVLRAMHDSGVPMIDTHGRPGSRRASIGFPHPHALGGVLMHLVQRPGD